MNFLLQKVVTLLVSLLDEQLVKNALDAAFDYIEDQVARSDTKYDDVLLLPVIRALRDSLDVAQEQEQAR